MTVEEYKERYLKFMEEFAATLPADLSDEQRSEALLQALDEVVAKDMEQIAEQSESEINHALDDVVVAAGNAEQGTATEEQLAAIRQTL